MTTAITKTEMDLPLAARPDATRGPQITSLEILERAVSGGITSENIAVVKEIIAMRREEVALESKAKFNRAFFGLREEIGKMSFYADKAAKTDGGAVAYTYCSEKELSSKLDPVLSRHGFAMLFGQRDEAEKTVAIITLIHKDGHEENREYAVRSGGTNRMKDATAADTGATTSAWRHLVIKMFGIKSRISEDDDARNVGDTASKITADEAAELQSRLANVKKPERQFLDWVGYPSFEEIPASCLQMCKNTLTRYERAGEKEAKK